MRTLQSVKYDPLTEIQCPHKCTTFPTSSNLMPFLTNAKVQLFSQMPWCELQGPKPASVIKDCNVSMCLKFLLLSGMTDLICESGFVLIEPSETLWLTVHLIPPVSCAKDPDNHHLRCHKLPERKCHLQGHPLSSHWDQDHHIRVSTGEAGKWMNEK